MNGNNILKWKSEQSNWHRAVSQITQWVYVRARARVPARECGFPGSPASMANYFA